ncbi:MAG TPA: HEAT repeat domain-containing protein [Thermoanaerobaculia bacterium]|nr:HEAT repeat domain-containing protein [Thermoanaerobaculia bacterium]
MPLLLTESLDHSRREQTHQHIESCEACSAEWSSYKETWGLLGGLPEVEVPARVRERVMAEIAPAVHGNVVRFPMKWLAQAAAVVILVGGSYYAGHRSRPVALAPTDARVQSVQPFSIAETRVLPARDVSPTIQGRPNIHNVAFTDADASDNNIGLSFDVTSRMTVTGSPNDPSMVRLLSYVLENENSNVAPSRSRAIEWVRQTYSDPQNNNPEIASALARVLRTDTHEGVRIRAAESLKTVPGAADTRQALIDALKSDPNPAVRIKAVEALANIARKGGSLDDATLDTLRAKASQDDENMYVRVKAAEALSNIRPQ